MHIQTNDWSVVIDYEEKRTVINDSEVYFLIADGTI